MKVRILLLFIIFISGVSFGQTYRYDTIRYARAHYHKRLEDFHKDHPKKGRVVVLGNSITEFGDWKKLLGDSTVINRGIAGDNTFGILDRLDEIISLKPSRLFVEAGINDIAQNIPADTIVRNMFKLARQVNMNSPLTRLYIYSVLFTNENSKVNYPKAYHKNEIVKKINAKLQRSAVDHKFTFIDLNVVLSNGNDELSRKYADNDGLHLNNAGYEVWVNLLVRKGYINQQKTKLKQ